MDLFPPLLLTLAEHAHRLTVLDIHCRTNHHYKDVVPSVLCKFKGLKELSLRDIVREWDDYAKAIATVLINSPNIEALRVATWAQNRIWNVDDWNQCCNSSDPCPHALLPAICEKFVRQQRKGEGRPVNGVERTDIPRLKLREVTVDHHSMSRFILDIPDPDGNRQNPLYLEKLTDLQYLERLHIEIPPINHEEGPGIVRLPNLTPVIAPRLRSLTISPARPRESRRWHKWVLENNFLDYARQVSLGRLEHFLDNSRFENLILDWSDRVNPHESLYTLLYLLKQPATTKSLQRLELNTPGDWTELIPSLKDTVSHLGKLKYFNIHLTEYYPPLCLSWEALKRDKHFRKMVALAEDFFEVQPSLHLVEVNYFLYQVVRWGPGTRDFHLVEVLDREREWVPPEDTPWQGPEKDSVPFRMLL